MIYAKYFNFLEGVCMRSSLLARKSLLALAAEQGGYFTAHQAITLGYTYPDQVYHVAHSNWERVERGIYHLSAYPECDRSDLVILSLMSINRQGMPQAVASYETALAIHELSDANPAKIHLTVPPGFRRHLPKNTQLHYELVDESEKEQRIGYWVTTPLRTICDIAASPQSWIFLEQAIRDALRRGLIRRGQILNCTVGNAARERLQKTLAAIE